MRDGRVGVLYWQRNDCLLHRGSQCTISHMQCLTEAGTIHVFRKCASKKMEKMVWLCE